MLEIVLGCLVFISIVLLILTIFNNKFQLSIIKIEKAEEDINMCLEKKKDLLNRTRPVITKELKIDEFLNEIDFDFESVNNIECHNKLKMAYNELFKTIDDNEKLLKSDSLVSILDNLNTNEEEIIGAIKFYNDTVVEFNQLVVSFPSSVIALFKRYKKKEFYNNEKREIFEILSDKQEVK